MGDAVRDQIRIEAPPDTVFDVIGDVERYPEWQREVREVETLEVDGDGWPLRVRFVIDATVFTADYVLGYAYTDTTMTWHLVEGDALQRLDGTYELHDRGDGSTDVVYELTVVPAVPMPGMLRRKAAKRIVDGALAGLKRRVESGA